ncbi:MAG: hypothetical protein BIFFINMI_03344 [Phycisphaerae bacterium]|nr:hypothetical protein [Phycisphaerae bacterium]
MSKPKMQWTRFPADWMKVEGLAWWNETKPALIRLPRRMKAKVRPEVWNLARQPAGARIRFATDATHIGIRAKSPDNTVMDHITRFGQMGYDLYVDGQYHSSCGPDGTGRTQAVFEVVGPRRMRQATIYLPLYKEARVVSIGLSAGAKVGRPRAYRRRRPIVIYGTSITQGGCASNTGMAYPSIVGRMLGVDTINLGFSGNGRSEPEVAEALAEIDAECYVLDQWANTPDGNSVMERYPRFLEILRAARPATPILVTGPFAFNPEAWRAAVKATLLPATQRIVRACRRAGDGNIHWFDSRCQIADGEYFATVDGIHCNSLGFYKQAAALAPVLRRLLKL